MNKQTKILLGVGAIAVALYFVFRGKFISKTYKEALFQLTKDGTDCSGSGDEQEDSATRQQALDKIKDLGLSKEYEVWDKNWNAQISDTTKCL